jgi:plastocyanin
MARIAPALALAALFALGCGGGGDDGGGGGKPVTVPANDTLNVTAKEYEFDASSITVEGAGRLTLDLKNDGSLAHDIVVRKGDEEVGGTQAFPAGESRKATVDLDQGTYEFLCTVGDHAKLGMKGTLTVK